MVLHFILHFQLNQFNVLLLDQHLVLTVYLNLLQLAGNVT